MNNIKKHENSIKEGTKAASEGSFKAKALFFSKESA